MKPHQAAGERRLRTVSHLPTCLVHRHTGGKDNTGSKVLGSGRDKWAWGPGSEECRKCPCWGRGEIEKLLEENKINGSWEMEMAQLVKVPATKPDEPCLIL